MIGVQMVTEDPLNAVHEAQKPTMGSVYSPRPFSNRNFVFQNKTLGTMADAEIKYARIDERSVRYPYNHALRVLLAHLEAMATICVDGTAPDIETMLLIEAEALRHAKRYGYDSALSCGKIAGDNTQRASQAAVRYCAAIQDIACGTANFTFDRNTLLRLHSQIMYEDGEQADEEMHFREQPYRMRMAFSGVVKNIYIAPEPDRIPMLIDDLMSFCNGNNLSPTTQAAVAHFHLEAIRPFKTGMDRTGRAFAHMIMKRRLFYNHIIPPIAVVPAMNVRDHAQLLFPYRANKPFSEREAAMALDRWTFHCAECMAFSVSLVRSLMDQITDMEEKWLRRLPGMRKGSVIDLVLQELPGKPIITVATVMDATGKGFSAANDAIHQLVEAEILRPMNKNTRNRCFESPDALNMVKSLSGKIIPTELISRESAFH
ncbi:Fic family protein [Adlercreutzia sp. ZJ154]|uniref:Fic family protein n=1 Tax=Adlercreutzia sp. ZJ154 TaxID=2709790 RepID=UPI0013EB1299|nr:Fic family protein [Adlercreutzia sp. ZJ154]